MKILLVEDNEVLAHFIKKMLEDEGFEVVLAGDGKNGYLSYLTFKPDMILTDIRMPGENGLQLMKHIRRHNPMIKTVYMSASLWEYQPVLEEEREKFPVRLLEKPFSRMELMRALSE